MGWRSCVLFEHKFEVSGDIWVEMLGKAVGIHKKPKGRCGLKKSSWETSSCVQIVTEAMEVVAFSEKCRELETKPWRPPADKETQQELVAGMCLSLFWSQFKCTSFKSIS